jgi:predicted  nucleic acid-binding Zn-ribbon protein
LSENSHLGDEVRLAQENLRLSASQINKLQNEFKAVCDEYDAMKRQYAENDNGFKKFRSEAESKIALMSQEIERLNGIIGKKNE